MSNVFIMAISILAAASANSQAGAAGVVSHFI
jgi:hypothetical protein